MSFRSLKAKIILSVIIVVVVIEGVFLYLNIKSLTREILVQNRRRGLQPQRNDPFEHSQCHDQGSKR